MKKQNIAYEMIACTFRLGLIMMETIQTQGLGQTMGSTVILEINNIVHRLEARGGQSHLIMFLTGMTSLEKALP
jgi:hypothetical protein